MKLEVGRIYVLVDEAITHFEGDSDYRRLVKLVDLPEFSFYGEVEGLSYDGTIEVVSTKTVDIRLLKPASEKQRAMFIKKEKELLS